MKTKIVATVFLAAVSLVAQGCKSLDKLERQNFQDACDNLGIQRGTPSFDACMLQQQQINNENVQRAVDRANEKEFLKKL